jgi:hypothetical protein
MRDLVGQGCVDTVIHDQLALALDDAHAQLKNPKVHRLAPIGEPMHTVDVRPRGLAVEQGGSDDAAATHENRNVASLDARKTRDDEQIRRVKLNKDSVHQGDAPYIKNKKNLVVGRGIANEMDIKTDERQEMFTQVVAGAEYAPADRHPSFAPNNTKTTRGLVVDQVSTRTAGVRTNECQGTFI